LKQKQRNIGMYFVAFDYTVCSGAKRLDQNINQYELMFEKQSHVISGDFRFRIQTVYTFNFGLNNRWITVLVVPRHDKILLHCHDVPKWYLPVLREQ